MGFGPVRPERENEEPIFHARWEARALALTLQAGALGHWNIDRSRHARESLHPSIYYSSSYYEIWIRALINLLCVDGLLTRSDLEAAAMVDPPIVAKRHAASANQTRQSLASGTSYLRNRSTFARFAPGDRVRTTNNHPAGHTRLPRYARGRLGVVECVRGVFVYPDANAHGPDEPQWCYTVRFLATELFGESAKCGDTVSIDAFEPYLNAVREATANPEGAS